MTSTARVATDRPASYLKQLCEHFADPAHRHRGQEFDVTFDEGVLVVEVAKHLERFGQDEGLTVEWRPGRLP